MLATLIAYGVIRAAHSRAVAIFARFVGFKALSWPRRILYTIGGMLMVWGVFTTPRPAFDIDVLFPWPLFSVIGLLTAFLISLVLGYVAGNVCFPRLLRSHRRWAVLAFCVVMGAINPVVGFFTFVDGLLVVIIVRLAAKELDIDDGDYLKWINYPFCSCPIWHPPFSPCVKPGSAEWEAYYGSWPLRISDWQTNGNTRCLLSVSL